MTLKRKLKQAIRPTALRWIKRLDSSPVRHARLLAERVRTEPPFDVLYMGASESLFTSPDDVDPRPLPAMVADELAPELSTYAVAGAAHNPRLYKIYLDIVAESPVRPLVILGMAIRLGVTAWSEHPEYSHDRPIHALEKIPSKRPPWRFRAYVPLATDAEFAAHDKRTYPTMDGTRTIGDFRLALKDPVAHGLTEEQRLRLLYSFHHGSTDALSPKFLDSVTAIGARLRELGLPAVVYQMPVPIVRATDVMGQEIYDRTVANLKVMDDAFIAGYGPIDIVQTGVLLKPGDYIDPDDGTEHVNEHGRRQMTDLIVAAVHKARLSDTEKAG
ncbi:MAG TPA: hypothetical protein VHV57_06215 [Acidimicrobiales bacterium]|nr:hypothetical protein [Acidimicrobiales bacterium]